MKPPAGPRIAPSEITPPERYFTRREIMAGLAGAIWVPFYRSVAPSYLTWIKSGEPVMAAILGGPSLFFGPVLGMFIMTFFHAWVLGFTVYWPVVMGAMILLIIFFLPGGILGYFQQKVKERKENTQRSRG